MTASPSSKNSTTVRSIPLGVRALRAGLWLASHTSPPLATKMALDLFLRPRRFRRPGWERALLFHADSERVPWHGRELPIWAWGEGPRVLLVHGWEGRGSQLGAFVDPLVRRGFRVITFDAPGHGDGPGDRSSIPELADAIAAVADHVGPLHAVVAHSMGAVSTMLTSARAKIASRLVLVSSPTRVSSAFNAFSDFLELPSAIREALPHAIEDRFALRLEELEISRLAPRLGKDVLVVHDRDDRDVPFANAERLVDALGDARLVATTGLGHRKILRDPVVLEAVASFVEEGAPARAAGYPVTESLLRELYDRAV